MRLTAFERAYLLAEPFLPVLYRQVRRRLLELPSAHLATALELLDVGGRKSHYTIGVPARVTISDLPRTTELQRSLNLGLTKAMMGQTRRRRSNVAQIVLDDMTQSHFANESFDCIVAVEVLEHVKEDGRFLREVERVLRPGGHLVITTPNGDWVANSNPDHQRHYRASELRRLLEVQFVNVEVSYAVREGRLRTWGLRSWSWSHPIRTAMCMAGNWVNGIQSRAAWVKDTYRGTRHLFAVAKKPPGLAESGEGEPAWSMTTSASR